MLFLLALVVAVISRTVTQEEVFRELRVWCDKRKSCGHLLKRKAFYLPTCRYCFSHWVTAGVLLLTHFHLGYGDWRGYIIAEFAIVGVANLFAALYERLTVSTALVRAEIKVIETPVLVEEKKPAPRPLFEMPDGVESGRVYATSR